MVPVVQGILAARPPAGRLGGHLPPGGGRGRAGRGCSAGQRRQRAPPSGGRRAVRIRGAGLVIMHTRAQPKHKVLDPDLYDDVTGDVIAFLRRRIDAAVARGDGAGGDRRRPGARLRQDPGPDGRGAAGWTEVRRSAVPCCWRCPARTSSAPSPGGGREARLPGTLAAVGALAGPGRSCGSTTSARCATTWRWRPRWTEGPSCRRRPPGREPALGALTTN